MVEFELQAEARSEHGTSAMRRLRRMGKVPAVLYGGGKDPVSISLDGNRVKKQVEHEAFFSHVLTVKLDGSEEQAVLKDLQRHPATSTVTHMDLLRVVATQEIVMNVPIHFINEDRCVGKKAGGVINHVMIEAGISCLPKDLPEYLEVDVAELGIGEGVTLRELALPSGVVLTAQDHELDSTVVSVAAPTIEVEPSELEGEEPIEAAEPPAEEGGE